VRFLIDENINVSVREPLRILFAGHEFNEYEGTPTRGERDT